MFRQFVENLPLLFYAVSPSEPHSVLYLSQNFERFGYPLDDWLNDPTIWERITFPADRERTNLVTKRAITNGESLDIEYRVVKADGEIVWVRDRSCFTRDESGTKTAWQGIILDITERKRMEAALIDNRESYRRLIDDTSDIIYSHELDGRLKSINNAIERILGYKKDEALTMNIGNLVAPHSMETVRRNMEKKVAGKTGQTIYEVDCIRKDGSLVSLEINSSLVLNDGVPVAVQGVARDVTERKTAEDALRNSEANLAAAQRIAKVGSWELEINDVNDASQNILTWSDEMYRIFGYEPRSVDVTTQLVYTAVRPSDQDVVSSSFTDSVLSGERLDVEVHIVLPTGLMRLVHAQAETIYDDRRRPIRMVGTLQDITDQRSAEEALVKSEARFRDLFENANDLIYTHDLDGNFTSLNRAGQRITGYSLQDALSMNVGQVIAPEFVDATRVFAARKLAAKRPKSFEVEIVSKTGERISLDLSTRVIVSPEGLPIGVQGIGRDVTERRQTERRLHETLSLFSTTFESTADGIIVMSLDRQIITCNQKFIEMWDIPPAIIDHKDGEALVDHIKSSIENPDDFSKKLQATYEDPTSTISETLTLKDGRIFERYSQPQYLEGVPVGRVASFRDITERNRAEERLRYFAMHDALTDLPNRPAFMAQLERAVERGRSNQFANFAVLFLDLDRFKVVNDSLGHAVGDKLLVAVAEKLKECVRPGDVVARLGGDEFTILLNRCGGPEDVSRIAERLQSVISEPVQIDNYEVFTTTSIGIVIASDVERTAQEFLRDADAAMYRAKEAGKARSELFDREMHVRNMNLLQVETDLRHAVERQEFEVLYQPIADLYTGCVREFEALIRWRHPVHGLISPNEFMQVAEETGLIIPIGQWILEESCRQTAEWNRKFQTDLGISVNLSAKQLMHPSLSGQLKDLLAETGLKPHQLKIEVTEGTVMEHSERSQNVLAELDRLDISLSTDDFGTGYSSLSYLQKFPFDRLKIDKSFTQAMDGDNKTKAIVRTILMLGDNLGIEVVAEGVETIEQLETLREIGCTLGQGYLFARPIDAESAEAFLADGSNVFDSNPSLIAGTGAEIFVEHLQ